MTPMDMSIKSSIPVGRWLTLEEIARIVTPKMPKAIRERDVMSRAIRLARAGELRRERYRRKPLLMREN